MPRFDGTGPFGGGPGTGRGMGPCGGGRGRGRGFGWRRFFGINRNNRETLEEEAAGLEEELKAIKSQIANLKEKK